MTRKPKLRDLVKEALERREREREAEGEILAEARKRQRLEIGAAILRRPRRRYRDIGD